MYELFISSSILMLILRSLLSPPPLGGSGSCGGAGGPCGGFPWSAICIRSNYYFSRRRAISEAVLLALPAHSALRQRYYQRCFARMNRMKTDMNRSCGLENRTLPAGGKRSRFGGGLISQTAIGIGAGILISAFCISRQRRRRASFFLRNLP